MISFTFPSLLKGGEKANANFPLPYMVVGEVVISSSSRNPP
jgi:hypothetical protein